MKQRPFQRFAVLCAILGVLASVASHARAAESAETPCVLSLGAQTHFGQGWPIEALALAAKIGASHIRDGISWARTEKYRGIYNLHRRDTAFLDRAADMGLGVILVFATTNDLYDGGMTPYTEAGRQAFAHFVTAVVDEHAATIRAIEIGNEFNGTFVTGPARDDRIAAYTALLRTVHAAVKAHHPDLLILGGAAHSIPVGWFRDLGEAGALAAMDGVAVHPYRTNPEHLDREIGRLRAVIGEFGPPRPIYATEFGLETDDPEHSPDYLLKMVSLLSVAGVCEASWYALREQDWYPNMGLFSAEGRETPAARAFSIAAKELLPSGSARRLTRDPLAHVYRFGQAGPIVAWGAGHAIRLENAASIVRRSNGDVIATPRHLDARPIIVTGGGLEIGETETAADTLYQYGGAPWSYFLRGANAGERPLGWRDWNWTSYLGDPAFPALSIQQGSVSPAGRDPEAISVVERFTTPRGGVLLISGLWSNRDAASSDGVRLDIAQNGAVIWSHPLDTGESFELSSLWVEVSAGDALDFIVAPNRASQGDATRRRIIITRAATP